MGARVLLVDDEEGIRNSLSEVLIQQGYQVMAVATGEAAVRVLRAQVFDVILLDLRIPKIDGLEVLRIAKKLAPDTVVILFTGYGSLESAVEALRHGAHDYLLKPASARDILSSIEQGLERRAEQMQRRVWQEPSITPKAHPIEPAEPLPSDEIGNGVNSLNGGFLYDATRRKIWNETIIVSLTPTENRLFSIMMKAQGEVLSHRELVTRVHGFDTTDREAPGVTRPIISRLRRKLEALPGGGAWIINIRGTGYLFDLTSA